MVAAHDRSEGLGPDIRYVQWLIGVLVVVFLSLPCVLLASLFGTQSDPKWIGRMQTVLQQYGTFGDMFGVLNALCSAGAFVGVVYAVLYQRKEIRLQQIEIAKNDEQRREDAKSRRSELKI